MHPDIRPYTGSHPWSPWRFNLGDHWMTACYLISRSYILREEMHLSRWQHGRDFGARFQEILALIQAPERSLVTVVDQPGRQEPDGFDVWTGPAWPTKLRWDPCTSRMGAVAYQFDGRSNAEGKNPPAADHQRLLDAIGPLGVRLGAHQSLEQIVRILSRSSLFLGVDSGMSHIAHSVGIPAIIVEYNQPVITCHRCKHYRLARGTDEALAVLEAFRCGC